MTHVTCRLTAKNRDQLRNPTLGNRVWATFFTFIAIVLLTDSLLLLLVVQAIKSDLTSAGRSVSECRQTADQLSTLCGSPSDVSVHKCISDLDTALSDIDEGLDERQLELSRVLDNAQRSTTCLDVRPPRYTPVERPFVRDYPGEPVPEW